MNKIALAAVIMSDSYSAEYLYDAVNEAPKAVKLEGEHGITMELDIDSYNTLDNLMYPEKHLMEADISG